MFPGRDERNVSVQRWRRSCARRGVTTRPQRSMPLRRPRLPVPSRRRRPRAYLAMARARAAWTRADCPAMTDALEPFTDAGRAAPGGHPNLALWRYRLAQAYLAIGRGGRRASAARAGSRRAVGRCLRRGPCPAGRAPLPGRRGRPWCRGAYVAAMPQPGSRDSPVTSSPNRRMYTEVSRRKPDTIFSTVVFPAPLGRAGR